MTTIPDIVRELNRLGHTKEYILDSLVRNHEVLLHGSRVDIQGNHLRPNQKDEIFATNLGCIAILKAIFSNIGLKRPKGLGYSYYVPDEPLILKIHGIQKNTIGNKGFVYIITDKSGFHNTRQRGRETWEYVKYHEDVSFSFRLEIERKDFTYPVFDVTNNKRIQ